jgi:SAM-dependent methyltransferase
MSTSVPHSGKENVMSPHPDSRPDGYEAYYREFDTPLMQDMRREAYLEDIGQHSWVSAEELRGDIARLALKPTSRFLDLGCGPGGPLTFVIQQVKCHGTGIDISPSALQAAQTRAARFGIDSLMAVHEGDLNDPLPFAAATFDAIVAIDSVLHLRDRGSFFREVARLLTGGGRFLFTDAGVITGTVSNEDIHNRSNHGYTQFVVAGSNEQLLSSAGLRLIGTEDRTEAVLKNVCGRLKALEAHQPELERVSGASVVARQKLYLESVAGLSERKAISRIMYLVEG